MSRPNLFYNHKKVEDVRMSRPELWVSKWLHCIKDVTTNDVRYFVADNCENIIPNIKKSIYEPIYHPYSQDQDGVADFFQNFKKHFLWNTLKVRKVSIDLTAMKKCCGMNKDYEVMDEAVIYIHYDIGCVFKSSGEPQSIEVCDKLVVKNNKIIEYHHRPDLVPVYKEVPPPAPINNYNVIDIFERCFAGQDIPGILNLLAPDFTFRIYCLKPIALIENFTDPNTANKDTFPAWLMKFYKVVKILDHKVKQQVNDNEASKSFVTVVGNTVPSWSSGLRKPWAYYDIHNFDLTGPYNDQATKIKSLVWHIDYHPLALPRGPNRS